MNRPCFPIAGLYNAQLAAHVTDEPNSRAVARYPGEPLTRSNAMLGATGTVFPSIRQRVVRLRTSDAIALLLVMLAVACGGGGDGGTTGPNPNPNPGPAAVASVSVTPATASLTPQQTTQLSATTRDAGNNTLTGRTVTWSSSAPAVATVSSAGMVTAVAEGSATITATSEGRSGTATITVSPAPVSSVTLSAAADTLQVGETRTLEASARAGDGSVLAGRTVTWSSAQPAIATVADGLVTAVSPGVATVTATSEGQSASAEITVRPIAVATLTLSDSTLSLIAGTSATLSATPRSAAGDSLDRPVTWSVANSAVATVVDGVVTAVSPGTTTVTASSEGVTATATIEVTQVPVAIVQLNVPGDTLEVGANTTLVATVRDAGGAELTNRTLTWSSNATAIATVSDGLVTAVSPGTATISVISEGQMATAEIVVKPPFVIADIRRSIVPGFEQSCAIAANGGTYCWGSERYGALGNGIEDNNFRSTAAAVSGGPTFTSLAGGYSHSCGLTAAGEAWCWGKATLGQLGDGSQTNASMPVAVSGGHLFEQLSSSGSERTCGIKAEGEIWCWGSNSSGALGVGATGAGSTVPVRVAGSRTYRQVSMGSGGGCALRDDGAAYCWGSNFYGQLGRGTTGGASSVPVAVSGDHRFVELTAGFGHYCGRKADSSIWCWGFNSLGQLGDGSQTNSATPVQASVGTSYVAITASSVSTCGLTENGAAFCWGGGSYGALGNGDTSVLNNFSLTPVMVLGGLQFRELRSSASVVCGATFSSDIYCWGNGTYGNGGWGDRDRRGVPSAVVGLP